MNDGLPGPVCGRLAPSPTGLLHLGNAWAFLLAWLAARVASSGNGGPYGRVLLRLEDIDPERSRREWAEALVEDLSWLGLDWDEGPLSCASADRQTVIPKAAFGEKETSGLPWSGAHGPYEQSRCGALYEAAFAALDRAGLVYPCYCTRRELRTLAGAPHGYSSLHGGAPAEGVGDSGAPYPGTCRRLTPAERAEREAEGRRAAWRLACPENYGVTVTDAVLGERAFRLADCGGDFPLRRSDGVWSYQLAVTVDDARMGVTQVVRGEDILSSTPRQMLLWRLLYGSDASLPQYAHIPLLHDAAGERLAKRHQSLSLRALREAGVRPEAIVGWLAGLDPADEGRGWAGDGRPVSAPELRDRLRREQAEFPWIRLRPAGSQRPCLRVPDDLARRLAG